MCLCLEEAMKKFPHINGADALVTTKAEVRAGFVKMALLKNKSAIPFVAEGRALRAAAQEAKKASDLLSIKSIRPALLTASGLSDKAQGHLEECDKEDAISGFIEKFLETAGNGFVDELVYRFLLIKGDSLGGAMRNVAGFLAEETFKMSIIAALSLRKKDFSWKSRSFSKWTQTRAPLSNTEDVVGISWNNARPRVLVFNKNIPVIKKNVDICLLESHGDSVIDALGNTNKYLLLGELKGGIDPAGADEHWKTARTSIERILGVFRKENVNIKTLFVGAAIEKSMAVEIWSWLQNGKLSNAGNLTDKDHIASICGWLVEI